MAGEVNPKDIAATRNKKPPLARLEYVADIEIAKALQTGAEKYGKKNYHTIPIGAECYGAAIRRHIGQWLDGEDFDSDSGLSHIAHIGANVHVLLTAIHYDNLIDDRAPEVRSSEQDEFSALSNAEPYDPTTF